MMSLLRIWNAQMYITLVMCALRIWNCQMCIFWHCYFRYLHQVHISSIPKDNVIHCVSKRLQMLGMIREVTIPIKSIFNKNCNQIIPQCNTMENIFWQNLVKSATSHKSVTNGQDHLITLLKSHHLGRGFNSR